MKNRQWAALYLISILTLICNLAHAQKSKADSLYHILQNLADIYAKEQKDSLALCYYEQALELSLNEPLRTASLFNSIGLIYLKRKEYSKSVELQNKALAIAQSVKCLILQSKIYADLSAVYEEQKMYSKSLFYANQALEHAIKINSKHEIKDSYYQLFKTYYGLKDYQKAFQFQSQYMALNDSLLNSDNKKTISHLKYKYNTEKNKQQIASLSHRIKIEHTARNTFLGAFMVSLVIIALIINRHHLIKKRKQEIEKQHLALLNEQALREEIETKYKTVAEELNANKEKYKLLAESGNDIIGLYDIEGFIQYVSPALTHILGYTSEEVIGKKLDMHPIDKKIFVCLFQQALDIPGKSISTRIRIKDNKENKQYRWFNKNLKAILDSENNVIAIRWLMHDISTEIAYEKKLHLSNIDLINSVEQYKALNEKLNITLSELEEQSAKVTLANQKLIESQNSLQRIYYDLKLKTDALNKISITISSDKDGYITSVNNHFTEVLGYSSDEVVGKTYHQLQPALDNSGVNSTGLSDTLWNAIQETKEWSGEICVRSKSGKIVWLLKNIIPIWNRGCFVGHFSFSYDITLQKKREEEIIQAKLLAEEASAIKEDFLSVMSHEIRTPLNSVIGLSNLLLKRSPREDQLEIVKTLKHSGDNLVLLINDILDYNKIRAGKIELEEATFSPIELLKQLQSSYQLIASEKGLDFLITIDTNIPDCVIGDLSRLNQILHNLINNALKFTRKGHVRIHTSLKSKSDNGDTCTLLFAVGDSGIGIPREKLDAIFTAFNQSEKYISREFGGTGLGLSIVKNLVDLFDGEIDVLSEVNKGSEFLISIPFKINAGVIPVALKSDGRESSTEFLIDGYRVLYVEDVESNQLLVKSFLEDRGVNCTIASNGNIALQHTFNKIFDVILMDLQMPGLNGYEVTAAIREQKKGKNQNTPIIAFTAEAYSQNLKNKIDAGGFQDLITKPFQFDNLIGKISKVCPAPRPHEDFLSLDFYEDAFDNNQQRLKEIKKIIINDITRTESSIKKYSATKDLNGIKAEIHKLSPITKNIRCYSLAYLLEQYRVHETYSNTVVGLTTELLIFLKRVREEIGNLNY